MADVVQRYDMTYGARQNDCGTDMHVLIKGKTDPDIKKGGQPSVTPNWFGQLQAAAPQYVSKYVRQGHLLNDNIGGPGNTMDNLTPITASTNTTHLTKMERKVKSFVLDDDLWVEYRVRPDYSTHPNLADLGHAAPAAIGPFLQYMAGTIGVDYIAYDNTPPHNIVDQSPGELLIKNEGAHLKGNFV